MSMQNAQLSRMQGVANVQIGLVSAGFKDLAMILRRNLSIDYAIVLQLLVENAPPGSWRISFFTQLAKGKTLVDLGLKCFLRPQSSFSSHTF